MEKSVRIYNDDFNVTLTDIPNLKFLDYNEEGVEVNANTVEINGTDGVITSSNTFGPFNLVLRFFYSGRDRADYNLTKQKLRGLLFRRDPYYIWHSDQVGKKYAVYCEENSITDIGTRYGEFEIKFVVYKGYSESYRDTTDIKLLQENIQFEQGLDLSEQLSYKHNSKNFTIYNGSSDTIDPFMRNKLIIKMNAVAPNGFKIRNKTTGDIFEYKKKLKKSQEFILNGVYPYIDRKRVGIDTNYGYIRLKEGLNNISIEGDGVEQIDIEFIFNFIYR